MMAEKVVGTARQKNAAPAGLQKVLNRLAKLALSNSPCCFYECFATALERDTDWRTLVELQLAPCKSVIVDIQYHRHFLNGAFKKRFRIYTSSLSASTLSSVAIKL